jgi:hypothetical protein
MTAQGIQPELPLLPLPALPSNDNEVIPAKKKVAGKASAVAKVAGSRRKPFSRKDKENGSKSVLVSDSDGSDSIQKGKCHGQPAGSSNFLSADLNTLLDFVEAELPGGQNGWRKIHAKYAVYARQNHQPAHTGESLKTKYKQVSFIYHRTALY